MLKMTYSYENLVRELPALYEQLNSEKGVKLSYSTGEAGALKVYITCCDIAGNNTHFWVEIAKDGRVNNCVISQKMLSSVFSWIASITSCRKRQTERLLVYKQELLSRACRLLA